MIARYKNCACDSKSRASFLFVRIVFCEVSTILQFPYVLVGEVNSVNIDPLVCNYFQVQ